MKHNDDDYICEEEPAEKGEVIPEFIKKHNLSENSHPADWFKDFL